MSTVTCPQGHPSTSVDYCDVCGVPIPEGSAAGAAPTPEAPAAVPEAPKPQECPSCGSQSSPTALFCEACGYDFTTGTMPRPPDAAPATQPGVAATSPGTLSTPLAPEWVAELWVDPDWYATQGSDDPCPSPGLPVVVPLTQQSVLVGRPSKSRSIHPDVDCSSDSGVSRRQAQLTSDGQRWWVEDLQSSNGTYVGPASGALPTTPITPGQRHELGEDDRVYIGTWTRLVVRRATAEEKASQAS